MKSLKGIIAGVCTGLVGTLGWGALFYLFSGGVGLCLVLLGFAVGLAVFWGSGRQIRLVHGCAATLITLVSIVGGIVLAASMLASDVSVESNDGELQKQVLIRLAHTICEEKIKEGEELTFPPGITPETAESPDDFPPGIAEAAGLLWKALPQEERQQRLREAATELHAVEEGVQRRIFQNKFQQGFGWLNLFGTVLAAAIAFQVGSGGEFQKAAPAAPKG